jgi:hypothetical protein
MIRFRIGSDSFQNARILPKFVLLTALFPDKTNPAFSEFIIKHVSANRFRHVDSHAGASLEQDGSKSAKNRAFLLLTKVRCIPIRNLITALQ